ncbi:hypothetical protein TWF730_000080 [Orbilia blumenaviensis]|uniref:Uncharacterized protein n=1 Tax=Orbilia blumenaviensis TaxID=1796055 RepID=A0AAV9VRL8_9PEZI
MSENGEAAVAASAPMNIELPLRDTEMTPHNSPAQGDSIPTDTAQKMEFVSQKDAMEDSETKRRDEIVLVSPNGLLHLPPKHDIVAVELDDQKFELTSLRGYMRLLRYGDLAYVLEKASTKGRSPEGIRLVLPAASLMGYSMSGNLATLKFERALLDIIYPPSLGEDECKSLFVAIQASNRLEMKLHLDKITERGLMSVDECLRSMIDRAELAVPERLLKSSDYRVIHHKDYHSLHLQSALNEIEKKASNAQSTFGGTLNGIELQSEDQNELLVIIHHSAQQKKNMIFARIDEDQRFVLHFPGGTKLEAQWPLDYTDDYITSKVFRLLVPGLTERHRGIIQDYKQDDSESSDFDSGFRLEAIPNASEQARCRRILNNAVQSYREPGGFPLGPIFFSHPDRTLGTEVEPGVAEVIANSSLDQLQLTSAKHALCRSQHLPSGIALLTGAAGTGKTFTAATIVKAALVSEEYNRIIVTAKQNTALERIFESFMGMVDAQTAKVLYMQGKLAAEKMESSIFPLPRELIKNYKIEEHLEELKNSGESTSSNRKQIIGDHHIIFATLDMIQKELDSTVFPATLVLIDEAGATSELDSLIPITKFNKTLKRLILVGDAMQLQPYSPAADPITRRSLLLRCQKSDWAVARLVHNYRMHPLIALPIRNIFYNSDAMADWGLLRKTKEKTFFLENTEVSQNIAGSITTMELLQSFNKGIKRNGCWWDVAGREEKRGTSFSNDAELEAILILLEFLYDSPQMVAEDITMSQIGVISPYLSQVYDIKEAIRTRFPIWIDEGLEVSTVDAFQGREKQIILISLVRANDSGDVGFLNDAHRLCTALSRSRVCEIIVRNFEFIKALVRNKGDGIKTKGSEAGKNAESAQLPGKFVGRPVWALLNRYSWPRFKDERVESFIKRKEEAGGAEIAQNTSD